jgi:hypothetical protein
MDLKGTPPGTGFDQLQATGEALADWSMLDFGTAAGFVPDTSTKPKVLTAGQRSGGGFTRLWGLQLLNGRGWFAIYNPRGITLGVRGA